MSSAVTTYIQPQTGPQEQFLSSSADICVYGGAAGGGKTFALLLETLRHSNNPNFGAVIFRRTYPQIKLEGGLWDEASKLYPAAGGIPKETTLEWRFPSGAKVKFAHMQYDQNRFDWQGSQIPLIGFDELTHFSEVQVFYLLSRNRSTCGVTPYVRGTTNPDADSWVKRFLAPWVDEEYQGEKAESGEIRYFIRDGNQIVWLKSRAEHPDAKSVSFIRATIYDNKILLKINPEYLTSLKSLPLVERERLLAGNWSIRPEGGKLFKKHWFPLVETMPDDVEDIARYWDLAASAEPQGKKTDPDYTASACVVRRKEGAYPRYLITDVTWFRKSPGETDEEVLKIAKRDDGCFENERGQMIHTRNIRIGAEEEGGASGKRNSFALGTKLLEGFIFEPIRNSASKETRAKIASSQAQFGNIGLLKGAWNEGVLDFLEAFPDPRVHDDVPDAIFGGINMLFMPAPIPLSGDEPTPALPAPLTLEEIARIDPFAWSQEHSGEE